MKTLTLKINDDYFEKIVSFLELLPKKAVTIAKDNNQSKLKEIENDLVSAVNDVKTARTKKIRTIA